MPAARGQAAEQGRFRGLPVEMERLGIELRGKRLDLRLVDRVRGVEKRCPTARSSRKNDSECDLRGSVMAFVVSDLHDDSDSAILCQCNGRALAGWCARLPAASSASANGGASSFCAMPCTGSRASINSRKVSASRPTCWHDG